MPYSRIFSMKNESFALFAKIKFSPKFPNVKYSAMIEQYQRIALSLLSIGCYSVWKSTLIVL